MTPVHADVVDGPVLAVLDCMTHEGLKEADELGLGHLARCHLEILMVDRPEATDVAVDRDVVWRVAEHHLGAVITHQPLVGLLLQGAAAQEKVLAELPQIADGADCRAVALQLGHYLRLGRLGWFRRLEAVQIDRIEARDLEVEIDGQRQLLELRP